MTVVCACCGKDKGRLRCSRCKTTRYCTAACQRQHWKVHKAGCVKASDAPPPSSGGAKAVGGGGGGGARTRDVSGSRSVPPGLQEFYGDGALPVGVDIDGSREAGRGLYVYSKAKLPPGTLITASDAYAVVLSERELAHRCGHCHSAPTATLMVCSECKYFGVCSDKCMREAYARHRFECRSWARAAEMEVEWNDGSEIAAKPRQLLREGVGSAARTDLVDKEIMRLALRVLMNRANERIAGPPGTPTRGIYHEWRFQDVHDMVSHSHRYRGKADQWSELRRAATVVCNWHWASCPHEKGSGVEEVMSLLLQLRFNSFPVMDDKTRRHIGLGVFPQVSCFNHSCAPNAFVHSFRNGRALAVKSCRTIMPGDEVCIAYVSSMAPFQDRKRALESFHFECKCRRCANWARDPIDKAFSALICGATAKCDGSVETRGDFLVCPACAAKFPSHKRRNLEDDANAAFTTMLDSRDPGKTRSLFESIRKRIDRAEAQHGLKFAPTHQVSIMTQLMGAGESASARLRAAQLALRSLCSYSPWEGEDIARAAMLAATAACAMYSETKSDIIRKELYNLTKASASTVKQYMGDILYVPEQARMQAWLAKFRGDSGQ